MPDAESIYESLRSALPAVARLPEECWLVGGCIRDVVMGRSPRDVDCGAPNAASAAEEFASRTGGRKVCLARQPLETWRVVLNGLEWDFTDLEGGSIDADLARRDFTIGALAVSVKAPRMISDPFAGMNDLERKTVRMVAESNLLDDPLRMLRGVRLATTLGFTLEEETKAAIAAHAERLRESAVERITVELDEIIISSDVRKGLETLIETKLDKIVLPGGIDEASIRRCEAVFSPDAIVRYAAFFVGRREDFEGHAESARWSTDRRRNVATLLDLVNEAEEVGEGDDRLAVLVHDYGTRAARRGAELFVAIGDTALATRLSAIVRSRGAALESMRPLIDGSEVRAILGIQEGPEIGRVLRLLLEAQIRGTVKTGAEAEAFVRQCGAG